MGIYICIAFAFIAPYLICSLNPAIIAAKIKSGKDIREMGSGNPGLTNTLRTMGKRAAIVVLLFDVFKGVISLLLVMLLSSGLQMSEFVSHLCLWIASLAAVLGHCYPIYYKFAGGKAVLITVATLLVVDWISALILLSLFIIIVVISKYVSLGSIIAASMYPGCVLLIGMYVRDNVYVLVGLPFALIIPSLLIFKHRENIKRLSKGTEKKISFKKTEQEEVKNGEVEKVENGEV